MRGKNMGENFWEKYIRLIIKTMVPKLAQNFGIWDIVLPMLLGFS